MLRSILRCGPTAVLALALAVAVHAADPDAENRIKNQTLESVASLTGWADGRDFRATGFVVARADGKKVLITAGHVYRNDMVLWARLPGMSEAVECDLLAVSAKHDLMAIVPRKPIAAPALTLVPKGVLPKRTDKILIVGCPGGVDRRHYTDEINGTPLTAATLQEQLQPLELKTPHGDTLLLPHGAFSHPGMSGGPVVDFDGRVVGIQIGTLPKAANVGYAVSSRHVADLDLNAKPRPFTGAPEMKSDIGNVLATPRKAEPPPLLLRIGGEDVDGRCFHYGYVPKDAGTVIERYIQDKQRFREVFGEKWFQSFLDKTSLAHITNPTLGFRVLVPKGYEYSVDRNRPGSGVIVTFRSPDAAVPEAHRTITIRAYVDDNSYAQADRDAAEEIRTGKSLMPMKYANTRANRDMWHGVVRDSNLSELAESVFWEHTLKIKLLWPGVKVRDPKDPTVFRRAGAVYTADLSTAWTHAHYDSVAGDTVHSVHYAVRGRVTVIVHYQTHKKDRDNFEAGNEAGATHVERALITATVSLY